MFLKNWDMQKIYRANGVTHGENRTIKDKEVTLRFYDGSFSTNYIEDDAMRSWGNGYYQNYPTDRDSYSYYLLWPGGDIEDTRARTVSSIDPFRIDYEDYNLASPFYGGNSPGSGTIYGQQHVVSGVIYNEEKDQWERTVTREFKNISGKEITVKELGVFKGAGFIVAREILDEPIIIQEDSYFKLSFTWTVENPHENRKEKRIRQYSLPYYNRRSSSSSTPHSITPDQKKKMLLVRLGSIHYRSNPGDADTCMENFQLTAEGWEATHLTHFFLDQRTSSNNYNEIDFVSIELLTPDPENPDKNTLSMPHYRTDFNYNFEITSFCWVYLEDGITNVTYSNDENSLIRQLSNPIIVQKKENESNILWLGLNNLQHQSPWSAQTDTKYCDFYYVNSNQNACFFFDQTDATEHSFSIGNTSEYESIAMVRLDLTLKDGEVLYKDVPVNK